MISWVVLAGVERWGEDASWPKAVVSGLLWAVVVTGAWWFAEWTQVSRQRGMSRSERRHVKVNDRGR
ncbi:MULTISPECIES: hypothetical protein [unclassified Streptomyces]|uniref:hypothetical protein n=1 Tax=Streptomyces sp. DK15 TaxID=2957499 RepID=UPI0029AB4122|nr:hypothetical protein [Streptomyces sp. DK15]MDX2389322.1 hypothetical protein [Streptomyces sp. DK15]